MLRKKSWKINKKKRKEKKKEKKKLPEGKS